MNKTPISNIMCGIGSYTRKRNRSYFEKHLFVKFWKIVNIIS